MQTNNNHSTTELTTNEIIKELITDTTRKSLEELETCEMREVSKIAHNAQVTINAMILVAQTLSTDPTDYALKIKQNLCYFCKSESKDASTPIKADYQLKYICESCENIWNEKDQLGECHTRSISSSSQTITC